MLSMLCLEEHYSKRQAASHFRIFALLLSASMLPSLAHNNSCCIADTGVRGHLTLATLRVMLEAHCKIGGGVL